MGAKTRSNYALAQTMSQDRFNEIFRDQSGLTAAQKALFIDLATRLSPENISADGERPLREVVSLRDKLMQQWRHLERECLVHVEVDEVWKWK